LLSHPEIVFQFWISGTGFLPEIAAVFGTAACHTLTNSLILFVVAVRAAPAPTLVIVICAFGTTAPEESTSVLMIVRRHSGTESEMLQQEETRRLNEYRNSVL
jgi:hypothetical protein